MGRFTAEIVRGNRQGGEQKDKATGTGSAGMRYTRCMLKEWAAHNPDDGKNDIHKYADLFNLLAAECQSVTEFGVRNGISTGALLSGLRGKYRGYDLVRRPNIDMLESIAIDLDIDFKFSEADTRLVSIEPTDLLFIDACHRYSHVSRELKNEPEVKKYLVFHDTTECWERENGNPVYVEGIGRAIQELLAGGKWFISSHYKEGSGLMVLSRKDNQ
jgi:hypothetical protein